MSRVIDAVFKLKDEFSGPMKKCISTLTDAGREGKKARKSLANTGKAIQSVGNKATVGLSVPIVTGFTAAAKSAMDLEQSMAKVSTIADTSQVSMEDLQKQITNVSNETGVASTDIAESVYSAISAGQDTKDAVDAVDQSIKLAKSGFTDSATAMDTLTTVQNAYGKSVGSFEQISDKLITTQNLGKTTVAELGSSMGKVIPTASMYGVSLDNLASAYVATTKNGIATAESTTYINGMLNELGKSGSVASDTLKKSTGKSFKELMDSGKSLTDVLGILDKAAKNGGKSMADMFSSQEAGKAAATLTQHAEDFNGAMTAMSESAGTLNEAYAKVDTTELQKLQKTLNLLKNDAIALGNSVLPVLQPGIDKVVSKVKEFSEKFQKLPKGTQEMIVKIGLMVAAAGPLISVFGKMVTASSTLFGVFAKVKAGGGLLKTAFAALTSPAGVVVAALLAIVAAGVLIAKNWDTIKGKCQPLIGAFETVKSSVAGIVGTMQSSMSQISATVQPLLAPLADGFLSLANTIGTSFGSLVQTVAPHIQNLIAVATPVLSFFAGAFVSGITGALNGIGQVFSSVFGIIGDLISGITDTLSGLITFLIDVFKGDWEAAWDDICGVFSGIADTITSILEKIQDLAGGVVSAVSGAIEGVKDFVTGNTGDDKEKVGKNASGTNNWRGGLTRVNESGGEIIDLPRGTRIIPHDLAKQQTGQAVYNTVTGNTFVVREEADIDKITDQLVRKLYRAQANMGVT